MVPDWNSVICQPQPVYYQIIPDSRADPVTAVTSQLSITSKCFPGFLSGFEFVVFDLLILADRFAVLSGTVKWLESSCVRDLDSGSEVCCGSFGDGRGFPWTLTTSFNAALYASVELACFGGGGLSVGSEPLLDVFK